MARWVVCPPIDLKVSERTLSPSPTRADQHQEYWADAPVYGHPPPRLGTGTVINAASRAHITASVDAAR